jgi:hypothetical protein
MEFTQALSARNEFDAHWRHDYQASSKEKNEVKTVPK